MTDQTARRLLANNLRRLREAAGLSYGDLARKIGDHAITVSRIERGARMPSLLLARNIADALGVTVDELIPSELQNVS